MEFSSELQKAAHKYYHYCSRLDKGKAPKWAPFLIEKRDHYKQLTEELFRKEFDEWKQKSEYLPYGKRRDLQD